MYFAYGFPKSYRIFGEGDPAGDVVHASFGGSDLLLVATSQGVQLWAGAQQRLKLGELVRDAASIQNEGRNVRAWWCPQRRVIAVATSLGYLLFYGIQPLKEVLWHCPDGQEARKMSIYLQNVVQLSASSSGGASNGNDSIDSIVAEGERVADLSGDTRSLLVVLENGTMLAYSWSAKLRCSASPLAPPQGPEAGSRSRNRLWRSSSAARPSSASSATSDVLDSAVAALSPRIDSESTLGELAISGAGSNNASAAATPSALPPQDSLPLPTPREPQDPRVAVRCACYAPAVRLIAAVLLDGRVAIVSLPQGSGLAALEQARLLRWIYKPAAPSTAAVSVAVQPSGHFIAVGLAHGRLAIYSMASVMSFRKCSTGNGLAGGATAGQPEPERILSLAEWGYSSSMVGTARAVQWSPDGKVVAVGYSQRGLAVWTPSGCRVMCTLRQAAQGISTPAEPMLSGDANDSVGTPGESARNPILEAELVLCSPSGLNPPLGKPAPEGGILERGVAVLAWSQHGYVLSAVEAEYAQQAQQQLLEISFARAVQAGHRVIEPPKAGQPEMPLLNGSSGGGDGAAYTTAAAAVAAEAAKAVAISVPEGLFVLQAADRLLVVSEPRPSSAAAVHAGLLGAEDAEASLRCLPDLALEHVRLPQQYLDSAYPVQHVALAQEGGGRDIAVAGARGLAVLNFRTRRWRLFGDAMQERRVKMHALAWLPRGTVAAAAAVDDPASVAAAGLAVGSAANAGASSSAAPALLLFPRDHLDFSSLLARYPLAQLPAAMDSVGHYIALAFAPLEIRLLRAEFGASGAVTLTPVRELSILGLGGALADLTLLVPPTLLSPFQHQKQQEQQQKLGKTTSATSVDDGPSHCVILRGGGMLSVLDMQEGSEHPLSDCIESYWLPASPGARPALQPPARDAANGVGGRTGRRISLEDSLDDSPVAKSAVWLERHTSDVTAALRGQPSSGGISEGGGGSTETTSGEEEAGASGSAVEMPWWTYGARGMQLWFPSTIYENSSGGAAWERASPYKAQTRLPSAANAANSNATDPELEFDREVYPVGVSLREVSIVGITQRAARSAAFSPTAPPALGLHPHPESQPVLPCLLRRLLEQGRAADALELATRHSRGPHFARSLEWLLFTTLEADADAPVAVRRVRFASPALRAPAGSGGKAVALDPQPGAAGTTARAPSPSPRRVQLRDTAGPLLVAAARLVQQFPQAAEIIVSVARKTDAQLWPALFAAAGSPAGLCEGLLSGGALQPAACCLLIVDQMEGSVKAHRLALRLLHAALAASAYALAADLLRFLMPRGEDELAELVSTSPRAGDAEKAEEAASEQLHPETPPASPKKGSGVGWLWSYFSGADRAAAAAAATAAAEAAAAALADADAEQHPDDDGNPKKERESATVRLHRAASQATIAGEDPAAAPKGGELSTAVSAWRAMGRHAWKLLDSGALRELAAFGTATNALHGGLPALLATTARDVPLSLSHTTPSAAAIASALFVASNEFAASESDPEAAAAVESLLATCEAAGCVNNAAALALLVGDTTRVAAMAAAHPHVWSVLCDLVANDVHLCHFSGLISPPGTPLVVTGAAFNGAAAGDGQQAAGGVPLPAAAAESAAAPNYAGLSVKV